MSAGDQHLAAKPGELAAAVALRATLWQRGWRPMPVYSASHADPDQRGKAPLGAKWQERAAQDPPECVRLAAAVPWALNTGLLAAGLRPLDLDIDDPALAATIRELAITMLGSTIVRTRANSPRCLLLYRAAEGEPQKIAITGASHTKDNACKIEALGNGQQFVAFGQHPSGAELQWLEGGPDATPVTAVPAIAEAQLYTFLSAAAPLIGAEPPTKKRAHSAANGQDGASAHILDVIAALAVIPNADPADWEHWNTVGMATWAASGGSIHGFNAWCAWSAQHPEHDDDASRERWNHYPTSPPDRTGAGKLFAMARDAWPGWQRPSESRRQTQDPPAIVIRVVNPTELEFSPVPPRIWVVQDWLPIGTVTGNYGDGGTGKTLLSQLLQTSCATCIPWAGQRVLRCKSFGLYCEDAEEELHRRQDDINTVFDQAYSGLGDMRWISGVGDDWTLVNFTADGRMHTTERWNLLVREVTAFGARLLCLDTAADLFGGNENDRSQVRRFISLLGGLARGLNGSVLLNCHPSRSGLASGNLDGGSTAWSNTFRSRWSLARPDGTEVPADTPDRLLTRRKANYANIGDTIRLRWTKGVFAPLGRDGDRVSGIVNRAAVEAVFLALLDRTEVTQQRLSDSKNAGNYAPRVFARRPDSEGYSIKEFEKAMAALFTRNQIVMQSYGRPGDSHQRVVRAPQEHED